MARPRGPYEGTTDVFIPVSAIMQRYSAWTDEVLDKLGDIAAAEIKKNAQIFKKDTGNLIRSIKKRKSRLMENSVIAGAMAPHAHLLEEGHAIVRNGNVVGHVPARPFVKPAEEFTRTKIQEVVNEVLSNAGVDVRRV